jgi:hypothetical protein
MKTKAFFLFLILAAFTVNVKAQLAGKKFELNMEQMGTFQLKFNETTYELINGMGDIGVKGTYEIQENTIVFTDLEGPMACPKENVGKYKFTFENKELVMELIEDSCQGRPNMAAKAWKQINN